MNNQIYDKTEKGFTILVVSLFLLGTTLSCIKMTDFFTINPFTPQNTLLIVIQATALLMTGRIVYKYFKYRGV